MTNYDSIKAILDSWHKAKVIYQTPHISWANEYDWETEQIINNILEFWLYDAEIKSITPIPTKPPILEVGTEVVVLESAREFWYDDMLIWATWVIAESNNDLNWIYYTIDITDTWRIKLPHYTICKVYQ